MAYRLLRLKCLKERKHERTGGQLQMFEIIRLSVPWLAEFRFWVHIERNGRA